MSRVYCKPLGEQAEADLSCGIGETLVDIIRLSDKQNNKIVLSHLCISFLGAVIDFPEYHSGVAPYVSELVSNPLADNHCGVSGGVRLFFPVFAQELRARKVLQRILYRWRFRDWLATRHS